MLQTNPRTSLQFAVTCIRSLYALDKQTHQRYQVEIKYRVNGLFVIRPLSAAYPNGIPYHARTVQAAELRDHTRWQLFPILGVCND